MVQLMDQPKMMVLPMKIPVKELTCMARSYVYQDDSEGVLSSLMNGNYDLSKTLGVWKLN